MAVTERKEARSKEDRGVGKDAHSCRGEVKWCSLMGDNTEVPQKIKEKTATWPSSSPLGIHPKELKAGSWNIVHLCLYSKLFITAKQWKWPTCPWRDNWINKMWYKYTQWNLISLKKEILIHVSTWLNRENMLRGISQAQKDKYFMIPLTWGTWDS